MRAKLSIGIGATWLLVAVSAMSHHSFTAEFDVNRPIELTGTVTRVEWTNPHAWLYVDTEDDNGNIENWAIELLGINALLRRGWTRDRLSEGDLVDIRGFGARDGSNTGNASAVVMANTGESLWEASDE
jgi:hypothetical protein